MGNDKDTSKGGNEFFYIDKDGKKSDAALHAEILGDDEMPWDIDLEKFADMTPEEQEEYLRKRDDLMRGA